MTSQDENDYQTLVESIALARIKHNGDAHAHKHNVDAHAQWVREHKLKATRGQVREQIPVRVNPPLKRAIDKTAHELGISVSDFIRCALLVCTEAHEETHKEEGETT